MYKVKVTEIGSFVEELLNEKMVVLFGPTAPAELRDICVVHDGTPTEDNVLAEGGTLSIGDQVYTIKEFGEAANENMGGPGHLHIAFDDERELLPGTVLVTPSVLPKLETGIEISFNG